MNMAEFNRLIETYGTHAVNWPNEHRLAASRFAETNPEASNVLAQHRSLDDALDRYTVDLNIEALESRILSSLPTSASAETHGLFDRLIAWLAPGFDKPIVLWRPVLAASLPLVMGIVIGSTFTLDLADSVDSADTWADEVYLMALDTSTIEVTP